MTQAERPGGAPMPPARASTRRMMMVVVVEEEEREGNHNRGLTPIRLGFSLDRSLFVPSFGLPQSFLFSLVCCRIHFSHGSYHRKAPPRLTVAGSANLATSQICPLFQSHENLNSVSESDVVLVLPTRCDAESKTQRAKARYLSVYHNDNNSQPRR